MKILLMGLVIMLLSGCLASTGVRSDRPVYYYQPYGSHYYYGSYGHHYGWHNYGHHGRIHYGWH